MLLRTLAELEPGTEFYAPELRQYGRLLKVNPCRARVRLHGQERIRRFRTAKGKDVEFVRTKETDWTPLVPVQVIGG